MRTRDFLTASLLVLVASGCTSYSFGHRDSECDPDTRLAQLVEAYDRCKSGDKNGDFEILQDCSRARLEIERHALQFPKHAPTLFACAALAHEAHESPKAQRYLDALFYVQPAHAEGAILRSRIAIDEGNLPFAKRLLAMQIRYAPDHAGLREAYSGALYMAHDLEGARAEIAAAESLGAPAWRVAFNRGLIAEAEGQKEEARSQYQAAMDANPDFAAARSRLAGMNAAGRYNQTSSQPGKPGGG